DDSSSPRLPPCASSGILSWESGQSSIYWYTSDMKISLAFLFSLTWLWPALALACPACFTGSDRSRQAYVIAAVLMTVLPFLSIGGVVLWIAVQARKAREVGMKG